MPTTTKSVSIEAPSAVTTRSTEPSPSKRSTVVSGRNSTPWSR